LDQLFPFVQSFYACPSPLYFPQVSQHGDFIVILLELNTQQGDLLGGVLFALARLHTFHLTTRAHPTCVFPSLVDDTHTLGPHHMWFSRFYVFTITWGIMCIMSFSATNEMCSLASSWVGPFYITSSWLSYSRPMFSYFGCTDGIQTICWVICG
jgi:hypothetical protein